MPNVTLNFNHDINVSVQIGDVAYYTVTVPIGNPSSSTLNPAWTYGPNYESTTTPHWTQTRESVIMIGTIIEVTLTSITCFMPPALVSQYGPPPEGAFIMFSKDNKANLGSLLGYFALLKLRNNSTEEAELFGVAARFVESSK
ncbi:hypothetical protein N9987_00480 [bacterium]|nr:hypothetical protein [bacterium]